MKQKINFLIIMALIANLSFSQNNSKDSLRLDEVVVTGSKTQVSRKVVPLSVSQISQKDIERSGQMNILPALNTYVPGVFVTERNALGFGVSSTAAGSITMRGISSSPNTDVLVLIDGNPQYQGIFGHPLGDAYVASDVEKVEIIHGPASFLYGSNAMAGVINIITKKQHDEGLKVNVGASYGSYNTQKYYGTVGYKKDKLSLFASINHDQTDGTRANTDFNINNGYAKVGYELNKKFNLTADFSIAKFNASDNGSIYLPAPAPFNIDVTRGKASISVDNKFEHSEGGLKIYHNFGNHILSDGFRSTDRNSGAMLFQTFKLATGTNVTVGADFKQYGGKVTNQPFLSVNDSLITVNELAAYAYAQQTLFDKLTVSAGLRLENNSKFGTELVPIGGLTYNLTDATTFKASVSKGFRSPTIMELYMYAPNPDLQPERMMNYEISWLQSLLNNKLNIELTVFKVKGDNLIQVVAPPFPPKRQNVGSFDNQGIEFSAKYAVTKNLFIHANYSYLTLSKVVIAAPRQQLNVSANYSYKIWNLNVSSQYIEKLYALNSANPFSPVIVTVPDYFLLNSRLSVRPLKQLEVFVAANNLLNRQYQINYGYPMPGINFNGGFNVKF
ncbi:MAG: TonB-dependent receptor [Paludibacter sp.]|nr:TonB-dependent receptor [Paludibacter sp.]